MDRTKFLLLYLRVSRNKTDHQTDRTEKDTNFAKSFVQC